jgi:hypothetical protein
MSCPAGDVAAEKWLSTDADLERISSHDVRLEALTIRSRRTCIDALGIIRERSQRRSLTACASASC